MPKIGDPAPQFSTTDVTNNQTYSLSDYAGQIVLLVFSGPSWCGPCQFEAPLLQDLWETFENSVSQPKVQIWMVSFDQTETPEAFKNAVQTLGLTFPALLNPDQTISTLYGVVGVPMLFVIDTEQKICDIHLGAMGPADALTEKIYNMLIACGAAEPKSAGIDASKWQAVFYILYGAINDTPGMGFVPGGKPFPIDHSEQKQILLQLAIYELAKGVRDFKTAHAMETAALKAAEASIRRLVARNALQPKDLERTFLSRPKK